MTQSRASLREPLSRAATRRTEFTFGWSSARIDQVFVNELYDVALAAR